MKTLKNKSEITSKNLKEQDCDYKGHKLSYDKVEDLYTVGNHFHSSVVYSETINELKESLI